jgi:hypothetical protein
VHPRFFIMGSYHAPKSRAFFAAADMLSNVTNVNFGGHVMLCCFLDNQPVLVIVLIATGLVSNSSQPAAIALSLSLAIAFAVRAITEYSSWQDPP